MRRIGRRRAQRTLNDGSNLIVVDRSRPPGSRLIQQAIDAALEKTPTPLADRVLVKAEFARYGLARHAVRAAQDHTAALR